MNNLLRQVRNTEKKKLIHNVKSACVAIGLIDLEKEIPIWIAGSGFITDPQGFVLTATHVIRDLEKYRDKIKQEGRKAAICTYQTEIENNRLVLISRGVVERRAIAISPTEKFPTPSNYDAIVCRMIGNKKYSFINIEKPRKLELDEEILVCGYPGGKGTLNLDDFEDGVRVSSVVQTGKISSVMPMDDTVRPTGLITDIIGTGGTSGSPIVEMKNGNVIGLAQKVIPGVVKSFEKESKEIGQVNIGLIYGISNFALYAAVQKAIDKMKKELDGNGRLKPEFKERYSKEPTLPANFRIDLTKPNEYINTEE